MVHIWNKGDYPFWYLCGRYPEAGIGEWSVAYGSAKDEPILGPVDDRDLRCPFCWEKWRRDEASRREAEAFIDRGPREAWLPPDSARADAVDDVSSP